MSPPILARLLLSSNPGTILIEAVWGLVYGILSMALVVCITLVSIGIVVFLIHSICEVTVYLSVANTHFLPTQQTTLKPNPRRPQTKRNKATGPGLSPPEPTIKAR